MIYAGYLALILTGWKMASKPKCKICREPASIKVPAGHFCSIEHVYQHARSLQDKARAAKEKRARQEHRKRKQALKSRSEWLKDAQAIFNKYIRLRDAGQPCISCSRPEWEVEASSQVGAIGGAWDAGHYLTRGAFPELRFEELNTHRQCKRCNAGSGRFSSINRTVAERYRENLIKKIGIEKVEWLEGPHEPLKLSIEEIKELIAEYKAKVKKLLANQKETG